MVKVFGLLILSACLGLQTGCSKKQTAEKNGVKRQKATQNKTTQPAQAEQQKTADPVAEESGSQSQNPAPAPSPAPAASADAGTSSGSSAPPSASLNNSLDSLKIPPAQTLSLGSSSSSGDNQSEAPQAQAPQQPAANEPVEVKRGAWQLSDIKVLMVGTLNSAQKGGLLVIASNSLQTSGRATNEIGLAAQGIMCSTQMSQGLKDGDILKFVDSDTKPNPEDKPVTLITVQYKSDDNKQIIFHCQSRGDVAEVQFKENMESILDFRNDKGVFESDNQRSLDPRVIDAKTRHFKILNPQVLEAINVHKTGEENSNAVVEGKVVNAKDAMGMVYTMRARAGCQITSFKGELKTNVLYKRIDTEVGANDETRGIAIMNYLYEPEGTKNEEFVAFTCILRKNIPVHFIFNTFKGVLEFIDSGAAQ